MKCRFFSMACLLCLLTGCASHSTKAMLKLDSSKPEFASSNCQKAIQTSARHDDIKLTKTFLTPLVVVLSGGALAVPALATNAGLETYDHLNASDMLVACGDSPKSAQEITSEVATDLAWGVALGAASSAGAAAR